MFMIHNNHDFVNSFFDFLRGKDRVVSRLPVRSYTIRFSYRHANDVMIAHISGTVKCRLSGIPGRQTPKNRRETPSTPFKLTVYASSRTCHFGRLTPMVFFNFFYASYNNIKCCGSLHSIVILTHLKQLIFRKKCPSGSTNILFLSQKGLPYL